MAFLRQGRSKNFLAFSGSGPLGQTFDLEQPLY